MIVIMAAKELLCSGHGGIWELSDLQLVEIAATGDGRWRCVRAGRIIVSGWLAGSSR